MLKTIFYAVAVLLIPSEAFTNSATTTTHVDATNLAADVYYDKKAKRVDVWVAYSPAPTDTDKTPFKATSLEAKFADADVKLFPQPITKIEGQTIVIYNAYDVKTGAYNRNAGIALLFHYPIDYLDPEIQKRFSETYPQAILKDRHGTAKYFKGVVCRITEREIYPIAAIDLEPSL